MEHEPSHLEALLQEFDADLEGACEIAQEMGGEIPLENLETYEKFADEKAAMMTQLQTKFGFNYEDETLQPVEQYETKGTPGTPGEGTIVISVFKTNQEGVYIGKWVHGNGDVIWTIRPLNVPE